MIKIKCILVVGILLAVNFSVMAAVEPERETVMMRVVAANPSQDKIQKVPVKIYLPQEITPDDIVSRNMLEVEYDSERSVYYVYNDGIELQPGEIRVFNVEIKDIWIIPKEKIDYLKGQTDFLLTKFEDTLYYENANRLADTIYKSLDTIKITQSSETVSRKKHIGLYRNNLRLVDQIEKDLATLERQLTLVSALPVPEVLEKMNVKTEAPSKTATWMIIFIIMIFIAMLTGVFFLTWHTQARFTKRRKEGTAK